MFGEAHAACAFELERLCDDANSEDTHIAGGAGDHRGSARSRSTTHTGGNKHHVRACKLVANFINDFFCRRAANFRLGACTQALGHLHAHLDHTVRLGAGKRLCVRIANHELAALKPDFDHVVHCIAAGATDDVTAGAISTVTAVTGRDGRGRSVGSIGSIGRADSALTSDPVHHSGVSTGAASGARAVGETRAAISAGAAVAATTIKLRTLEGIERPGIASYIPTEKNVCVLIDAGANIDAKPLHLLQYAIMGSVLSKHVLGYANPEIGLMSIGGEDVKGSDFTKDVFKLLKASSLNFRGNIEGHDLFEHPVEVVLCDGFTGNVVLKTAEATASAVFRWLKHELTKTPLRMAGAWIARNAFRAIRKRTNYENYGGSPLLGVNGICIIAHGSSTPLAIKNAVRVATEFIDQQVNPRIVEAVKAYNEKNPLAPASEAPVSSAA